ncbi:metallophosphoesterase family protein [Desertibacillus haloalkaliphilus]|uniref:metallophosphoesterase family protein n=1 Tax=Desertibacillus haloalkaliphilus TaxID=1328930 RepID=UPI001C278832|nr:metallophosphoesterase family protein [Desertibacillus haloalkaliphilus]MBU8907315.1 metallophosphatase family protein [Desertibacillus haloalkaliphilus]
MKLAFISDIHGNAIALESVLADIRRQNVDEIIVLGDLCYRGPEPKRSLQLIRSLETKVIKGNADEWVVRGVKEGEVPDKALTMMNAERDWTVSHLDQDDINYLASLPTELELPLTSNRSLHAFHATPNSLFDVVLPDTPPDQLQEKLINNSSHDLYIYAHIHLPYVRYFNGKCYANLGSVGLPFDGLPQASYAIVEVVDERFKVTIERVPYDVDKVIRQYSDYNFPNADALIDVVKNAKSPF